MNRNVVEIIKEYNSGRKPDVLEKKYALMASNPFSFFRGTCHLFYQDLIKSSHKFSDSTHTWICGDLHLENFGVYKGENQLIYFDINDFDESTLAPCTYDLSRFISSLYLSAEILGLDTKTMDELAHHFLNEFSAALAHGKAKVIEEPCASGITLHYFKQIESRTKKSLVKDWLEEKGGKLRFKKENEHLIPIEDDLKSKLFDFTVKFLKFYYPDKTNSVQDGESGKSKKLEAKKEKEIRIIPLDAGFRIAGTGSLGLNRYLVAVELEGKVKFIDIKEAQSPSISLLEKGPKWNSNSERICTIQEMMQGTSPSMLSSGVFENTHYVVRSVQPEVDKLNLVEIKSQKGKIQEIISEMAILTASAYIRSSGWKGSSNLDQLQAFAARKDWHKSVLDYGKNYVIQVQKDYEAFKKDFESHIPKKANKKEKTQVKKDKTKAIRENIKSPGAKSSLSPVKKAKETKENLVKAKEIKVKAPRKKEKTEIL